jgi:hypothetical protein
VKKLWVLALLRAQGDNCQTKKIQDNRARHRRVSPTYGFAASPKVGSGATVDILQAGYPYIQASSQDKERSHAPTRRHMPCSTRPYLAAKVGSRIATCLVALDPTSLIGRAPTPSYVPWLRTLPLQGRTPVHHVSYSSGSCLLVGEGFRAMCVLRLQILPPYREGSGATTACLCGFLRTAGLKHKKCLAVYLCS